MKKMKTKLTGAVAIAMVLSIAFSGIALASQPVCPPPETDSIKTVTMISCRGMVAETEKVSWETSNEDLINNPPLANLGACIEFGPYGGCPTITQQPIEIIQ